VQAQGRAQVAGGFCGEDRLPEFVSIFRYGRKRWPQQ